MAVETSFLPTPKACFEPLTLRSNPTKKPRRCGLFFRCPQLSLTVNKVCCRSLRKCCKSFAARHEGHAALMRGASLNPAPSREEKGATTRRFSHPLPRPPRTSAVAAACSASSWVRAVAMMRSWVASLARRCADGAAGRAWRRRSSAGRRSACRGRPAASCRESSACSAPRYRCASRSRSCASQ